MGKIDAGLLLSWDTVLGWGGVLMALTAVTTVVFLAQRPKWFWPVLIVGGILGCGPRTAGYLLLDEIISGSALLGALLRIALVRTHDRSQTRSRLSAHHVIFYVWTGYMVMQAVVGVIFNDDLRIVRWVLFYSMIGIVALVARRRAAEFPFPSARTTSLIIVITTVLLYLVYMAQGMYFDHVLGTYGRFLSQDTFWAGSAYAVFPTLVAAPAAFLLLSDRRLRVRALGWFGLLTVTAVAFYYDSRISILVIAGVIAVAVFQVRATTALLMPIALGLVFVLFVPDPIKNVGAFAESMADAAQALWAPGKSDVNRNLQLRAGFARLADNPRTFLIGDGVYSHRYTAIPHVQELYSKYLPEQDFLIPGSRDDTVGLTIFRTVGFTALLIDTGVIGMLLLLMSYVFVALKLVAHSRSHRLLFLLMLGMSYLWLLSNNITDITLYYLLIMPNGLLEQWSRKDRALTAT